MTRPSTLWLQTLVLALALALLAAVPALVFAQGSTADVARFDYGLRARALADGVYVVEGAVDDFSVANGCNIINTGFITTGAGVVVVNTGPSRRYGEQLRRLIARTTTEPVVQVVHLNLHPDYFLGNQGFADVPRSATPTTRAGIARESASYETNLYRVCGDWMLGTETVAPDRDTPPAPATTGGSVWQVGARAFELREFSGHTASDLVLIDRTSGVGFVGGLVFVQRIPTTPHAEVGPWLKSLDALDSLNLRTLVPSHGPVQTTPEAARDGIAQTRRFLQWVDQNFSRWAAQGWEMNEVLRAPVPAEFRGWAAFKTEYTRNVAHLYPVYEQRVLGAR
jgi:quinoprotein relay system zinc metallohydrolase 1